MATHIPEHLLISPPTSDLLAVDARIPLPPLLKTLADAGYTIINNRRGQLVVTERPEDFKPAPRAEEHARGR
ncbi:MAG TPA: hypothetical protein VFX20_18295 [Steroidobacteraceae bacterium]|nr:hypothetical protein [Steroidobacteraceae bacterium]